MKYVRKTISLPKDILETGKERARQFRLAFSRHLARLIEEDNPINFLTELKRRNVSKVADCLHGHRVAADADSDAGFSISRNSKLGDPAGLHRRTDKLTPINTWLLLAKLIAQLHCLQRALTPRPIPCLFCDR